MRPERYLLAAYFDVPNRYIHCARGVATCSQTCTVNVSLRDEYWSWCKKKLGKASLLTTGQPFSQRLHGRRSYFLAENSLNLDATHYLPTVGCHGLVKLEERGHQFKKLKMTKSGFEGFASSRKWYQNAETEWNFHKGCNVTYRRECRIENPSRSL